MMGGDQRAGASPVPEQLLTGQTVQAGVGWI